MRVHTRSMFRAAAALAAIAALCACGNGTPKDASEHAAATEFERGPHRGRLLRKGKFAIEMTIFEDGVEPEFHAYPFDGNKPVDPKAVDLDVTLTRLGNRVDKFAFTPKEDFLLGGGTVHEPHSFDVAVRATYGGKTHEWNYASYEGRTTISAAQAEAAGVTVEAAGPAKIEETVALFGRIELQPQGRADVVAWYPGRITAMTKAIGAPVKAGELLARVIASESLQSYDIKAPIAGVIMERNANVGDVTGSSPLYVIADTAKIHAEFFIYPRDAERLRAGQGVIVRNLSGDRSAESTIEAVLPTADMLTQTVIAHVELPNPDALWRPGQAVEGDVVVATHEAPLAVRTRALQRFRDFTVVYARVGETYEVRMLELGRRTPEWTEVLGGIEPGTIYVSDNSFLIRADVEKSGASHDH